MIRIQKDKDKQLEGKRILFVFNALHMGGAERQALLLAQHLIERQNAQVEFWGFDETGRASELCDEHGIPWRIVRFRWMWWSRKQQILNLIRLGVSLRRAHPDVIMPYTMLPNVVCGLLWRWSGARTCVWNQRDEGRDRLGRIAERLAIRFTPWYISNSRHGADFLTQTLKAPARRVRVIYNGVELPPNPGDPFVWRQRLGLPKDTFVVTMIANLTRYKDHATLLRAWRLVIDRLWLMEKDAVLLLAGRLDNATDSLKAIAYDLNLGKTVRFLGYVDDVPSLLATTDLGVFSSRLEGVPNGILECMAAGLPVVATDIPGIREALGAERDYCFVAPGDEKTFAERIVEMLLDPRTRAQVGFQNKQRIIEHFAPQRMVDETIEYLTAICK